MNVHIHVVIEQLSIGVWSFSLRFKTIARIVRLTVYACNAVYSRYHIVIIITTIIIVVAIIAHFTCNSSLLRHKERENDKKNYTYTQQVK